MQIQNPINFSIYLSIKKVNKLIYLLLALIQVNKFTKQHINSLLKLGLIKNYLTNQFNNQSKRITKAPQQQTQLIDIYNINLQFKKRFQFEFQISKILISKLIIINVNQQACQAVFSFLSADLFIKKLVKQLLLNFKLLESNNNSQQIHAFNIQSFNQYQQMHDNNQCYKKGKQKLLTCKNKFYRSRRRILTQKWLFNRLIILNKKQLFKFQRGF
ncbi:hypothetical protein ABPG72_007104 [Tetrahymena utriculariae]